MRGFGLKNQKPDIRTILDLKDVVYDKNWFNKTRKNLAAYYMYRGVKRDKGLRFDITLFPIIMLGKELLKTKGHEHENKYGEMYKVLKGKAFFLMQKSKGKEILDVYAVMAEKGDYIIIPSDYGHITINRAKEELKTGNWSSEKTKSNYSLYEKMRGGCYYYTINGWIRNKNYKKVPKLRFEKPLKKIPSNLEFLKKVGVAETPRQNKA